MRFSLLQKMGIIVLAVAASFAFLMTVTWFLDAEMEDQTAVIRDHYIPLVELGYRLGTKFENMGLRMRDAVSVQDLRDLDSAVTLKNQMISELDSASKILDSEQIHELKKAIDDYFSVAFDTSTRLIKGETGLSIVESMHEMQNQRTRAESTLHKVTSFDRVKLSDAFASIFRAQQRSTHTRLWTGFFCVLFTLFVTVYFVRSMMLQLKEISRGLTRYGAGDFKEAIPIVGNDELSELSRQINRMADRIQSLVREIESFSYSIAHDLRAPLRSVLGFSDALVEDHSETLSPDAKALLARVTAAAKRMGHMVDGLLSISRLNRAKLTKQKVDLSQIVQRVLGVLKDTDSNRNVVSKVEENIYGWGDPNLLDMVISNLVGNAWKFTKRVQTAQIEFGRKNEDGVEVFFVRDNGAGFDMSYKDKLFGTFQRLHSENEFEGHGIGLATVKNIIDKHGGRIWADSVINKGTTFYFTLG